ncbi:rhodanese-like domain protein (macronuclear) [Tetrahymena thermophila SB210]|uniref:Rhodanese-like domain protein n=1 Tax=Tetrahymena thermophila (strain SB210) TaxID=312017 RepID=I7MJP7_TETTS|nr:rhodanese-like domain protein [Tetrahymena thermophila SB210]EAS07068.2 rhodanese-like domain protein [Tetrahymena thermophila SB210]|eukprot:XP_001027310.2 rhodanese-like domain protein [Tetrahymena thermophila SB210]
MYSNNNNQSNQWSGTTELILQPQKLAFDSEINLEKQYNSFEYTTHQQNKLKDLLHYQFAFEPDIYQLPGRINYKSNKINLVAEDYLPSVKIDTKVIKKIQSLLKDGLNKQFFLNGSSFESSSHDLVHQTFYLDKVSFDFEDSFEKSFYGRQEYSLTCFCIGDVSRTMKPSKIMQEQMKEAIKGISSFQGIDFSEVQEYQYRKTDLLYLNHYRIFLFFESYSNQKEQFKIHRYLYYPRINFTAQLISQPFKLVSTPIAAFLTQKIKNSDLTQKEIAKRRNLVRYGFLSLDRNSRMIPLHASDDYCVQIPLVGVWTYGIEFSEDESLEHSDKRFVWSLLAEFVKNKTIAQRFTYNQQQKTFILAVFNLDRSTKYYEICIQEKLDEEDETDHLYSQQDNLNESNCQPIKRNWCMIKNYSNSIDQSQIQMNYSNDIASKLSVEYPFRFSSKMIVNQFDDDEFFKSIKQQQMKQSQVVSQQQQNQQYQQTYNQHQNNLQVNNTNTINNKQTVKRNTNNTPNNINNNVNKQRQLQQANPNTKNVDTDETETQNQTINSNNHYNNNLVTIKSQILELQNKQEDYFLESQKSIQSASFANNQTFSQNLHLQVQSENTNNQNNTNTDQGLQLPPAAERIIQQQQEQINKMSQQIQQLTEALKQFQNNSSRQFMDNQSQYSYPLSPQSQSQIIQNPPSLNYNQPRNMNHPMYKNYPPMPPPYYYDQYHFYPPHPQMGPHQYPPYPPTPMSDHPYSMYHRAPYYMQESYISGDGKSSKVGMMNNMMNNNGNFNNFGVDAISDIQSIKKEDDTQSEASNQNVLNNFNNPQKNVINMNQQQFENRSFSNNNTMGEVNVNTIRNNDNSNIINNFMQQNQNSQINQSAQSAQSLQLVQQSSLQSINNQSLQDQSNSSSNNDSKKHLREGSIVNQIQKQISQFGIENTFQFKEEGNISVKGGRKSEFQFDTQQNQNDFNQVSEKNSFECASDQYSKYSAHMYYGEEQKIQKQNEQEKIISVRPSIDQPANKFQHKQQESLNQLHLSQIKLNQNDKETNKNIPCQNDDFISKQENKQIKSPAKVMNEENQIKLKQMEKNIKEFESEDTFTIDEIVNLKMKTDFFDSIKKAPCSSSSNKGKENNNNINTFQIKNNSNFNNNNTSTTNFTKSSNTPQSSSSNCQSSSSTKMQIPTIKQPSLIDSDDSDNDEMKEIQKRYKNYIGI